MTHFQHLPIKGNLKIVYLSTLVLIVLFSALSVTGIVFHKELYPDEALWITFLPNDVVNLLMGLPMISFSLILTRRQKLLGLLCFPGALFYCTYIYATYLLGLPFSVLFIPYLFVVALSIYTLIGLIASIDVQGVCQQLEGHVPVRSAGIILLGIAILLVAYQIYAMTVSVIQKESPDQVAIAQWIVDFVIAAPPVMIIGILMIRRKAFGYALGMSLLFLLSALFFSLVPFMIIKAVLSNTQVSVVDIIVVGISSLICIIPFGLFVKGLKESASTP
ncbi:MAG: hypothetical protein KAR16_15245 [Bacteroidales bacterium]|nr:hypothetical protein [Bacteroidales bacterium]